MRYPEGSAWLGRRGRIQTLTRLDLLDRLRVLFSGVICVDTRFVSEFGPGKIEINSVSYIGTYSRDVQNF